MTAKEIKRWLSDQERELYSWATSVVRNYKHIEYKSLTEPEKNQWRVATQIIEALESLAESRRLTVEAVKLIKLWHNMNPLGHIADGMAEKAWEIYYNQAPEMKEIRECIAGYPKEALVRYSDECDLCDGEGWIENDGSIIECPNCLPRGVPDEKD